jgi:hypothetical protein
MSVPRISVVIEAYNEAHAAMAVHMETMQALLRQDYQLGRVEIVLVGGAKHLAGWDALARGPWACFHSVRCVEVEEVNGEGHYWALKNRGGAAARGEIVAFTDSDVTPDPAWLRTIDETISQGAKAVVGPSQFRTRGWGPASLPMVAAAFVSWGFVLKAVRPDGGHVAQSLVAHNVAMRREVLAAAAFPGETRRSFGSGLLFHRLVAAGAAPVYAPQMRAAHAMTWSWWLKTRHFRGGWETYERWQHCDPTERRWAKAGCVEPLLVGVGRMRWNWALWWRYSRAVGYPLWKSAVVAPVAMAVAGGATAAEVAGMYSSYFAPGKTEHLAQF